VPRPAAIGRAARQESWPSYRSCQDLTGSTQCLLCEQLAGDARQRPWRSQLGRSVKQKTVPQRAAFHRTVINPAPKCSSRALRVNAVRATKCLPSPILGCDGGTSAVTAAMCSVRASPQVPPRPCRPAASGFAHREVSLRSCSIAGVASKRSFQRHLARHASTELIPANRVAQSELAPLNRAAPLPASRCCGVLRTAAARPACSRRNADPACTRGALHCRIADACASGIARRRWKSGAARLPRRVPPSAFAKWRSSWNVSCRLTHVVGVSSYSPRQRQGSDAEADFRRAAPAAANRQVEHALIEYK
jgi:hypothetical protein